MKNSRMAWLLFRKIILVLFVIFIILYFQVETGTASYIKDRTIITEENIKKFEEDVKNGEYVDIKNYTEENKVDTSNIFSEVGYAVSEKTSNFISKELVDFFKVIGKLFS